VKTMEPLTNILEVAALLTWIAAAIYAIYTTRRLSRRSDKILDNMEADLRQDQEGAWRNE